MDEGDHSCLFEEEASKIILEVGTGCLISWVGIGLTIWQWSLVVWRGILVNWSRCLIYLGKRLIVGLHISTIGRDTLVMMKGSLVNWRGILVDGRWNFIIRRGVFWYAGGAF